MRGQDAESARIEADTGATEDAASRRTARIRRLSPHWNELLASGDVVLALLAAGAFLVLAEKPGELGGERIPRGHVELVAERISARLEVVHVRLRLLVLRDGGGYLKLVGFRGPLQVA